MTLKSQIACQTATIDRLRAENANLRKQRDRAQRGRQQLLAIIDRAEPPKPEEWHDMVAKAWADMEAEE